MDDGNRSSDDQQSSLLTVPLVLDYQYSGYSTVKDDDEEVGIYDHYDDYLSKEGTSSFFMTCFNGLNALSGVGILSVPYALASGGWLNLVLLFIVAIATFYTGLLLRRCMDVNSDIKTYPDIAEQAFGHKGRAIVSSLMHVELYLVATGFLILEGDNLSNLFPDIGFELAGIRIGGRVGFVIIVALIIQPSIWLKDLSMLSYVSASGVLASVVIVFSVIWVGTIDGVGLEEKGKVFNLNGIPIGASLYVFCYCAHPVVPTIYSSMRNKRQFNKVWIICYIFSTICYASMAVFGYMMYGDNVYSQVTLNLPTEKLSSKIAIYTALVNPVAKYALMVAPIVTAIENSLPRNYNNLPMSLMVRTMLLISTVLVALAVPFFGALMSLVGASLSATASLILPCICYLKIMKDVAACRRWGLELVMIVAILLMGVSVIVSGRLVLD
ncbi:Amino acid transporter [Macleaya cordata]|uniref:Amino acid transporter n=1 Tax=Macleaya cordata TaxID=56857 RepID=A0A200QES7_MACCD|nr:Amino acid transporter [Macleaya cordata]